MSQGYHNRGGWNREMTSVDTNKDQQQLPDTTQYMYIFIVKCRLNRILKEEVDVLWAWVDTCLLTYVLRKCLLEICPLLQWAHLL